MTVIPKQDTDLVARTDADMAQDFQRWEDEARTTPLDLTGWSLRFVVKKTAKDTEALLDASTPSAIAVLDAAQGRFQVNFSKEALAAAIPDDVAKRFDGVYALQAISPAGKDEVWAAGDFALIRGL